MAWLDRDRTPALFAIATSVLSSLISLTVGRVLLTDTPKNVLLVWVFTVPAAISLIVWIALQVIRRARRRSQRAFLMVSAFDDKYYIASFVQQLGNALDRVNIDMVLKVPSLDYDASAQSHHLERALDRRHDYIGGVIFAGEVHQLREHLTMFCQKSRLPIVFTDLEPFEDSEYPKNSAFVGYDTGKLGELAGEWLVRNLRRVRRPRILIIASREHASRQRECAKVLTRELKDVTVTIDDSCAFTRSRAHDAVRNHVRKLDSRQCLHAIFCTDDEMGLGAVDALATPSPATASTIVIGIDGIAEARALIDSGSSPFRATVVQSTHQLAVNIVDALVKVYRGRQFPKRKILEASVYEAGSTWQP
jgi:ribose transport system substrate-binding protein